jgi:hypothetical protein
MSDNANQGEVSFEVLHDRFEQSHRLVLIESAIAQMRPILYHGDFGFRQWPQTTAAEQIFYAARKDSDAQSDHRPPKSDGNSSSRGATRRF